MGLADITSRTQGEDMEDPTEPKPPALPERRGVTDEPAHESPPKDGFERFLRGIMWVAIIGVVGFIGFWVFVLLIWRCANPDHAVC